MEFYVNGIPASTIYLVDCGMHHISMKCEIAL